MTRHLRSILVLLSLATLAASGIALASPFHSDEDFGWAIRTREDGNMSTGVFAQETLRKIQDQYGPDVLVIADGDERYVITDAGLIEDAKRATRKIRKLEPEIGEMAQAAAKLALEKGNPAERERLKRRQRSLEKAIEEAERDGEETEVLEQKLFETRVAVQATVSIERQSRLTDQERESLIRQRNRASEKVDRGMAKIHAEVREILERAKARGLARRVD